MTIVKHCEHCKMSYQAGLLQRFLGQFHSCISLLNAAFQVCNLLF